MLREIAAGGKMLFRGLKFFGTVHSGAPGHVAGAGSRGHAVQTPESNNMIRLLKNPPLGSRLFVALLASSAMIVGANAAIIQSNSEGVPATAVSATDLVNQGQATLASITSDYVQTGDWGTINALNNGQNFSTLSSATFGGAFTVTFALDLSANTFGYDITEINTYSYWGDALTNQRFQVLYTQVGSSDFISLGTFTNTLAAGDHSKTSLTSSFGPIAANVSQIRFVLDLNPSIPSAGTVWSELDVIGTAAVPEPGTIAMLFGGLFVVGYITRQRRQKLGSSLQA